MNEDILSFIWRFQYFAPSTLYTDTNEQLKVRRPGQRNSNAGPDFSHARIEIDNVEWFGCVEIHVKSSDWYLHQHEKDKAYESVVLHVVWENDRTVYRRDGTLLPTLTLNGIVRRSVLERYRQLQNEDKTIPCANLFNQVTEIHKLAMLDRVLLERLNSRANRVLELLRINQQNWEETSYQWLTQHFGFKLNDAAFLRLTEILPRKILLRHRNSLIQTEALLFGVAGLLPEFNPARETNFRSDDERYIQQLLQEYRFLSTKYNLPANGMELHEWRFLRLRPAGFPTVRLAQLATLISRHASLFSLFITTKSLDELYLIFHLVQSAYWQTHFQFEKKARSKVPAMGKDAAGLLIINAVIPLLVAYANQLQQPEPLDRALDWLSKIPAENNRITREWEKLGMRIKTASDSQALVEWYNHYCTSRRCLECTVGAALVRTS
jgi:hypothetical protein